MSPWAQAVFDTLGSVVHENVMEEVSARGLLEVLPLTHIRGRSLHDAFVIVDEAQSLERGVLLTVLSRIGQGSRVVLTHDVAQRDNLRVGPARRHRGRDRGAEGSPALRARDPDPVRAVADRGDGHRPAWRTSRSRAISSDYAHICTVGCITPWRVARALRGVAEPEWAPSVPPRAPTAVRRSVTQRRMLAASRGSTSTRPSLAASLSPAKGKLRESRERASDAVHRTALQQSRRQRTTAATYPATHRASPERRGGRHRRPQRPSGPSASSSSCSAPSPASTSASAARCRASTRPRPHLDPARAERVADVDTAAGEGGRRRSGQAPPQRPPRPRRAGQAEAEEVGQAQRGRRRRAGPRTPHQLPGAGVVQRVLRQPGPRLRAAARGRLRTRPDAVPGEALDQGERLERASRTTRSSGAYGIPQALPGSKMAAFGDDWADQPGDPDQVGPGLHQEPLRHPVRRLVASSSPTTGTEPERRTWSDGTAARLASWSLTVVRLISVAESGVVPTQRD